MSAAIIQFPAGGRPGRRWAQSERDALPIILILPVVRIERVVDERRPRRGRRRRREPFALTPDDLR